MRAPFFVLHCDDIEIVLLHGSPSRIAEAVVEGLLVVVEDFVDAQLVDGWGGDELRGGRANKSRKEKKRRVGLKPDLQRPVMVHLDR